MNPQELQKGNYVLIQFNPNVSPQFAEVISIDHENQTAELRPECQNQIITVDTEDKWKQIAPSPIVYQILKGFGFSEITTEIAYGWTPKHWTKVTCDRRYIFNLEYADQTWTLEVSWIDSEFEPQNRNYGNILYIHQLQNIITEYIA